jgi:DME family drug/metabolite transporter
MVSLRRRSSFADGRWLVLAAAALWGTTGTAQAFGPPAATPLAVGAIRLTIGALALLAVAASTGGLRRGPRLARRPLAVGAVAIAAYQLAFFAAVDRTGVAVGTLVGIGSAPIMAGVLEWAVNGRPPGRRWGAATALALAGCGLLLTAGSEIDLDAQGIGLALLAGLAYAVYTLASKRLLDDEEPDRVMAAVFGWGAVLLLPVLVGSNLDWLAEPAGTMVALHLGVVTVGVAYALFARGLRRVPVATAVTLTLAEPLTAAALGVVVLGEVLGPLALAGVGLLFAGLAILTLGAERQQLQPTDGLGRP